MNARNLIVAVIVAAGLALPAGAQTAAGLRGETLAGVGRVHAVEAVFEASSEVVLHDWNDWGDPEAVRTVTERGEASFLYMEAVADLKDWKRRVKILEKLLAQSRAMAAFVPESQKAADDLAEIEACGELGRRRVAEKTARANALRDLLLESKWAVWGGDGTVHLLLEFRKDLEPARLRRGGVVID